ncbi:isopenicillin N synthase family dioxygenase [Nocardiopsis sediminis]|uniref:Isopenicillin N synthase family dioxygenase n=1 Tax=Nocardiopsis sediminis TaxID=1778267 RepID=A0ABV8FVF0_9ACTN
MGPAAKATGSTLDVPFIDISAWENGPRAQSAIAARMDAAAADTGLMRIAGHGIPENIHAGIADAIELFFDRPPAAKLRYLAAEPDLDRGYTRPGPAHPESFHIGTRADDFPDRALPFEIYPDNIWPVGLPRFQPQVMAWFDAAQRLARRLMQVCAVALDLPEGFFEPYTGHSIDTLRLDHLAPAPGAFGPGPAGADPVVSGGRTDIGLLRILWSDAASGLQFGDEQGRWHDIEPWPGTLLVNVGDLLARWTNDRWLSVPHRVVPPGGPGAPAAHWRSAALTHSGDFDALVTTLPTCVGADRPDYYEPVTIAGHIAAKVGGSRWERIVGPRRVIAPLDT